MNKFFLLTHSTYDFDFGEWRENTIKHLSKDINKIKRIFTIYFSSIVDCEKSWRGCKIYMQNFVEDPSFLKYNEVKILEIMCNHINIDHGDKYQMSIEVLYEE